MGSGNRECPRQGLECFVRHIDLIMLQDIGISSKASHSVQDQS